MTRSSIWFQSEPLLLAVRRLANRSRTTCDFDRLRARASLAISAKSSSGIFNVSVFTLNEGITHLAEWQYDRTGKNISKGLTELRSVNDRASHISREHRFFPAFSAKRFFL